MTFKEWRAEVERQKVLQGLTNKDLQEKTGYAYKYLSNILQGRQYGQPCVDAISLVLGIETYRYRPEDLKPIIERR